MPLCPCCTNTHKQIDRPCRVCGFYGAAEGYVTMAILPSEQGLVCDAHALAALVVSNLLDAQDIQYELIAIH